MNSIAPLSKAWLICSDINTARTSKDVAGRTHVNTHQTNRQASSNSSRGERGKSFESSPCPTLQTKFTFHVLPAKNAAFSFASSNPDIGPQSRPSERAEMMK